MGRHRTPEEKRELGERARGMRGQGRSRREISAELGVGDDLLRALLEGVAVPESLRRPRAKDDVRAAAIELRRVGRTYDEIAAELGVSKSTCSLWLRDVRATDEAVEVAGAASEQDGGPTQCAADRAEDEPRRVAVAERRVRARELREQGLLLREIAAELGMSTPAAYYATVGLPVPPRGRPRGRSADDLRADQRRYWDRVLLERQQERESVQAAAAATVGSLDRERLHLLAVTAYWCEGSKSKPYSRRERVVFINSDVGLIRLWLAFLDDIDFPIENREHFLSIHESADLAEAQRSWAADTGLPVAGFGRPVLKRHNPRTVRHNTGDEYRGCLVVRLRQSALLYQRIAGTWEGIMAGLPETSQVRLVT